MKKALLILSAVIAAAVPAAAQPQGISDLTALAAPSEGRIILSWTVPDPGDGQPAPSAYLLKYATASVDNTDFFSAWVSTYSQAWSTLASSGTVETRTLSGLYPGATLYFAIAAVDTVAAYGVWHSSEDTAGAVNTASWAVVCDSAPAAVTGLGASPVGGGIALTWSPNAEPDVLQYHLERSTWSAGAGFVALATVAASSTTYADTAIVYGNTNYYRVNAEDARGVAGAWSSTATCRATISVDPPPWNTTVAVSSTTVLWAWDLAANATGYRVIDAGTGANYSGDLGPAATFWLQTGLTPNASGQMLVRAFNGLITTDGVSRLVYALTVAPGPATAAGGDQSVDLSWSAGDNGPGTRYRVYRSTSDVFPSSTAVAGLLSSTTCHDSGLAEGTTYHYRIFSVNGDGYRNDTQYVSCSTRTVTGPPGAFALTSPAANYISTAAAVVFTWQSAAPPVSGGTVQYEFYWSSSSMFTSSVTISGLINPTTTYTGFAENEAVYWKVRAAVPGGAARASTGSGLVYMDAVKTPPSAFTLTSPVGGVTLSTTTTPLFSWAAATDIDPGDEVHYRIEISSRSDFSVFLATVDCGANRFYQPGAGLADMTTYYWRVSAAGFHVDPVPVLVDTAETWASTGAFSIWLTNHAPAAFALLAPANGSRVGSTTPLLSWAAAADSDANDVVAYTITIASAPDFSGVISSATSLFATQYTPPVSLRENCTYYWRVSAYDIKGGTAACVAPFLFRVPVLQLPQAPTGVAGVLSADSVQFTLSWSAVVKNTDNSELTDLAGYRVYRGVSISALAAYVLVGSSVTSWMDEQVNGGNLYYRVVAVDASGGESVYGDAPIISSLGEGALSMVTDDGTLSVRIPPGVAHALLAANNSFNKDLRIQLVRDEISENGSVVLCYRVTCVDRDGIEAAPMTFSVPLTMAFGYGAAAAAAPRRASSDASVPRMAVYWHNGIEYLCVGGYQNSDDETVTVSASRPGLYQVRRITRPAGFALNSMNPPKVFTPGVDPYRLMTWYVDNPQRDKVAGKLFDLRGEFVANMTASGDATADTVILEWAGLTDENNPAPKGVYIYQIRGSGKVINGTVIVAR